MGQRHAPVALYHRERPGTHCTVGWVGTPGPVWTGGENLAPTVIRSPDRPVRSQSLYRLSYPAHVVYSKRHIMSFMIVFGRIISTLFVYFVRDIKI